MTTDNVDWQERASALADDLVRRGLITRPELREAFATTPRHVFVPMFQAIDGHEWIDEGDSRWLAMAYSDEPLVTQVGPTTASPDPRTPTSSSTAPRIMADMIETLGIQPGMDVLESGTGTGYNAAILCQLVGDEHVTTIDIDPDLVGRARERLATLGYRPSFEPAAGMYDAIVATHSVQNVPPEWLRWSKPGGRTLVDIRSPYSAVGAWALLTVDDDRAAARGRLMPARGEFMSSRATGDHAPMAPLSTDVDALRKRGQPSTVSPRVLGVPEFVFLAWRAMPDVSWQFADDAALKRTDGQWTTVTSTGEVAYGEPDDLWADIESLYETWMSAGRPSFDELEVVADSNGRTVINVADMTV